MRYTDAYTKRRWIRAFGRSSLMDEDAPGFKQVEAAAGQICDALRVLDDWAQGGNPYARDILDALGIEADSTSKGR